VVYVVGQPGRGKSPFNKDVYGELSDPSQTLQVEQRFTAPEAFGLCPKPLCTRSGRERG
jgi:hypothetical protein